MGSERMTKWEKRIFAGLALSCFLVGVVYGLVLEEYGKGAFYVAIACFLRLRLVLDAAARLPQEDG